MGYFAFPNSISAGGDSLSASDFNTATNPGSEGGGKVSLGDTIISGIVQKSPGDTISFSDFAGYTAAHFQVNVGRRNNDAMYGFGNIGGDAFGNMYNQGTPEVFVPRQNNYYFTQGSTGTALPEEGFMMDITSCFWREFGGDQELYVQGTDAVTPPPQYAYSRGGILDNPSPPPDYIDVPHSFWRWHRLSIGPRASQLGTSYLPPPLPYTTRPYGDIDFSSGGMPWRISDSAGTNPFGTTVGARIEVVFSTNRNDLSALVGT